MIAFVFFKKNTLPCVYSQMVDFSKISANVEDIGRIEAETVEGCCG
jgi:uncharacterized Fe-S radical SAM superfamily protein PflX